MIHVHQHNTSRIMINTGHVNKIKMEQETASP